jgi:hypothetical protein
MRAEPDLQRFDNVPAFNAWIDENFVNENGRELRIFGKQLRPSEILHVLSFDTYRAAFPQFKRHREESLITIVSESFPIIIAHPFYRFLVGSENEHQRLQFLRDTWEGLVNFVHALVVSEARSVKLPLAAPAKCSQIMSDSLASRIATVGHILEIASSSGQSLESGRIVDLRFVSTLKELNQTRNAFSHGGAASEDQAKAYIEECLEDVFDLLDGFSGIRDVKLIRYERLDGTRIRHERFDGHAKTKRFGEFTLAPSGVSTVTPLLSRNEALLVVGGRVFSAHPFLMFLPPGGHITQVAYFKKAHGEHPNRTLSFEIVGESVIVEESRARFQGDINEIRSSPMSTRGLAHLRGHSKSSTLKRFIH